MALEHMKVGKFQFRIRALENIGLPAFHGATLRGGFGQALKGVACALRNQGCDGCLLRNQCVYLYLFDTPPPADAAMMRLYPAAPHPFVIEPPEAYTRVTAPGETLEFNLVLIGRALEYLAYFTYAFIRLGKQGLGRGRGKFDLEEISIAAGNGATPIYRQSEKTLRQPLVPDSAETLVQRVRQLSGSTRLSLRFITPTRIKFAEKLVEKPDFHHLIRSLLRRISSLSYFHCGTRLELDFRDLIERAQTIRRDDYRLRWVDRERYSTRQKQHMTLGGFVGEVSFEGDFTEFLPFLALGELVHTGKGATFGLGRYETQKLE